MNTLILLALATLTLWALHISSCREGRDSKGRFSRRIKKQAVKKLFYSELRGGVRL